jgi:hypothetical protein
LEREGAARVDRAIRCLFASMVKRVGDDEARPAGGERMRRGS